MEGNSFKAISQSTEHGVLLELEQAEYFGSILIYYFFWSDQYTDFAGLLFEQALN